MDKYIYYTVNPTEQLFKQLSGFLYFLQKANVSNKILVLPRFELKNKLYNYSELFDYKKINENFKVITYNEYVNNSKSNMLIGDNSEAHIDGFWQLPINIKSYMYYRKHVSFNEKYFNLIPTKTKPYLAVHWRQDDFLRVRPHVVLSKEKLVEYIKLKLRELNLKSVYISTDSKNLNDIKYIKENLPTFSYDKASLNDIDWAILESIICAQSDYFIGTDTSLYSVYIMGERIKMNKLNKSEIYKII